MIKKLRLKVVAVCMLLVTAVLAVVFFSFYSAAEHNLGRVSQAILERVIQEDQPSYPSGGKPNSGQFPGSGKAQLPYFTVQVWQGKTVYVTGGSYSDLDNTEVLTDILSACMAQNRESGTIAKYDLRYLRRDNGLYTKIAFVDMSAEQATLKSMVGSYLQIGLAAMALLLGVSAVLAFWVTKPVEKAWTQQRQFLSDASHELKTPLTVILSNAELMESAPLQEKPARWADNILSEAQRMKVLVEEMLTLARADNAVRTSVFSAVNLSDIATDCALLFEPVAFEAGKSLEYEIPGEISVSGDGDKLRQLLGVLLDNAIKYGRDGEPVRVTLQKQEKHARLTVTNGNAGAPIPPEQLSRLFERFYRADDSRGEKSGFGLGLPIAASIAAEHRGTLRAESDASSTRFILTLPLLR
ncbi:MAG: HAMP domain-containing histidine kinase [Oscillibacter sp.]|jgi:two-component system sensor histidine kinase CiaH|nr:HAMP domain-containing histidine kinase [Oscillibacter sp.]